jgi:hypothetical protein
VWIKYSVKGELTYQDRRWTCRLCDEFSSTNSGRHGNTSNINHHLKTKHHFTKEDHLIGYTPKDLTNSSQRGGITSFLQPAKEESPDEAFLRFVIQTNQSFSLYSHPAFHGLYKSMGKVNYFNNDTTLRRYAKTRF